jgi:hypothetical protein
MYLYNLIQIKFIHKKGKKEKDFLFYFIFNFIIQGNPSLLVEL